MRQGVYGQDSEVRLTTLNTKPVTHRILKEVIR